MKQHSLSRQERLKSRKQIERLFNEGKYFVLPPFRVGYLFDETPGGADFLQIGVGVSSKYFKKAVDRNRVKRLIREAWRLQKKELADCVIEKQISLKVFIIYTSRDLPNYELITEKTGAAISKLISMFNETGTPNT